MAPVADGWKIAQRRSSVIRTRFRELATMSDQNRYLVYQNRQRNWARVGRPDGNGGRGTTKLAMRTTDDERSMKDWLAIKRLVTPRRFLTKAMTRSTRPLPVIPNIPNTVYTIVVESWFHSEVVPACVPLSILNKTLAEYHQNYRNIVRFKVCLEWLKLFLCLFKSKLLKSICSKFVPLL